MSKKQRKNIITHNKLITFLIIIFVVSFFLVSLFSSVFSYIYNSKLYDKKYQKFGVYNIFDRNIALNKTNNIINFFDSKEELDSNFFNKSEISHLNDVKNVLKKIKIIYYISLVNLWLVIVLIVYLDKPNYLEHLINLIYYSGIFILIIFVVLGILYLIFGFYYVFEKFHQIVFIDNYAFDPMDSNMKSLFPDSFFLFTLKSIFIELLTLGVIFSIIGGIIKKILRKKN
ncbi:DUF1461 domain-containing protein [archaeon]|nr:DUF1461 domain-containing protein [archaeon]MBT4461780.1 DUF1461 domain-containing protein [archaeon]MBT6772660.1 DUF1461 domain-containing protein [archaeon]